MENRIYILLYKTPCRTKRQQQQPHRPTHMYTREAKKKLISLFSLLFFSFWSRIRTIFCYFSEMCQVTVWLAAFSFSFVRFLFSTLAYTGSVSLPCATSTIYRVCQCGSTGKHISNEIFASRPN